MKKKMPKIGNTLETNILGSSNCKGISMQVKEMLKEQENEDIRIRSFFHFFGAYACITEDGSIKVDPENVEDIWNEAEAKKEKIYKASKKIEMGLYIAINIILVTSIFAISIHQYFSNITVALLFIAYGLSKKTALVYYAVKRILGDKDILQWSRFHAAEHAARNAYYDLKRIPTLEEIKNYSNYIYEDEICDDVKKAWVIVGVGICRFVPGWMCLIPLVIFVIFSCCYCAKRNFYFLECFLIANPTDYEYDAAIKALSGTFKAREEILKEEPGFEFKMEMSSEEDGPKISVKIRGSEIDLKKEE